MVDSLHRVWIGHDLFYFGDARSRARFLRDPTRYAPTLTDPVTLRRFPASRRSPSMTWHGRTWLFASDSTRRVFTSMPDSFLVRKGM